MRQYFNKTCCESLILSLKMIFKASLNDIIFPDDWKEGNSVPAHKKDLKNMFARNISCDN